MNAVGRSFPSGLPAALGRALALAGYLAFALFPIYPPVTPQPPTKTKSR